MAYKIMKYGGKTKIKDTKTGVSREIDIEKFMMGGGPGDGKPPKKEDLTASQVQDIRDTTGVQFTQEGANSLFETIDPVAMETVPEFNLGRYKDVGYFNVDYSNGEFNVSPTKRNPGNYAKYKEYLDYLQEQNPNVTINRRDNQGYLPMGRRTNTASFSVGGKMMNTGGKNGKGKSKELTDDQVQDVRDTTGVQFTDEGARSLFETIEPVAMETVPEFDLGRYKDVGYFNVNFRDGQFTVAPTKRNPGNFAKHQEYLDYLQEINPNVRINRSQGQGYLPFARRMEYGGKITQYNIGGLQEECPPGDLECEQQKLEAEQFNVVSGLELLNNPQPNVSTEVVPQSQLAQSRQDFINQQQGAPAPNAPNTNVDGVQTEQTNVAPSPDVVNNSTLADTVQNTNSTTDEEEYVNRPEDIDYNIFNPYGGVDIPTAAFTLGRSIGDDDTLGIVGSSLKLATGLGRNIVSGLGIENRENQIMEDYFEDQKRSRNPVQYVAHGGKLETFAYGGKKDEELATGEYMHGIMNPDTEPYNAEIEKGEYFQSNEGDIAQVVGDKHSKGGEKIQMEAEDRVLSDQLKLGKDNAKMLAKKYDLKLKAKDTYATVLDRFGTKSKMNKLVEEEAEILKKIGEQDKVEDAATRGFNLEVLTKKRNEILAKKSPIEEERKAIFEELFEMQEMSKPEEERAEGYANGGKKKVDVAALAKEFGIPVDRAQEIVDNYNNGGKKKKDDDKQSGAAFKNVPEGQSRTEAGLFGSVTPEKYDRFVEQNQFWFDFNDFDPSNSDDVKKLQARYNALTTGNPVKVDGKFGEQTASLFLSPVNPPAGVTGVDNTINAPLLTTKVPVPEVEPVIEPSPDVANGLGAYLFPDETPLPPSALQGTIKPERRFDRVRPSRIEIEPYLQDIQNREQTQIQSLEGLSPNVRAAVLANMAANNQSQESQIRNQIDTQNLASQEKAIYTNAQIQRMEENASEADRLAYEQRIYRAQALTDNDINNYYNQLQSINKQRFMDIHNLNLINQTNEDVYFDGQRFRRKTTDRELLNRVRV